MGVANLRNLCNRNGISCRDSNGRLLSRRALEQRYSESQSGGDGMTLALYLEASGYDDPDDDDQQLYMTLSDYLDYTLVAKYTREADGSVEVNKQRSNFIRERLLYNEPGGARIWRTVYGEIVYSLLDGPTNVLAVFTL